MDDAPPFDVLRTAALHLDDRYLARLITDLQAELEARQTPVPVASSRTVVEEQHSGGVTDRLEYVRCGKPGCRCQRGVLHGPYWYRYQRVNGKLKSRYLGKSRTT